MYICLHVKYPLFLSDFMKLNSLERFSKNAQVQNFMKIVTVGAVLFHGKGRTDKHDAAFRNFGEAL
jgi:hypothetical protein